jgi:hypothetical protein
MVPVISVTARSIKKKITVLASLGKSKKLPRAYLQKQPGHEELEVWLKW